MSAWSVCYSLNSLGYLKHAWDDVLSFKRASRSLAKTGSIGPSKMVKNHSVFDVFRRWRVQLGFLTCKYPSVFEVSGGMRVKNPGVFDVFTKYF